ncbi:ABC transporter substrate-binding protein [Streptomyces sp. PT12]|uniref:ABC transporter substrate-binding protein n=1 Tax=Streptomyces sp. PT12 TaxID=1510197 RepID=UPI000DE4AE6D|nr:extracellular solute-binding protein [Streptomyces sp. PT12]RBM06869.1 hypothetical protein DEH69_25750 [Streptomyces sp. PT12]
MSTFTARRVALAASAALILSLTAACGGDDSGGSGGTTVEFFQSKTEAVDVVDQIIADFEAEHPGIDVEQNNTPDAMTVLQSRLAKGEVPDVIAVNVSDYNDLATAGILKDLAGTEAADAVSDDNATAYVARAGQTEGTTPALPWSVNAQVVLYDVDQFDELGLTVPTTWDEFVDTARAVEDAGQDPFYFTWKDSWTAKLVLNSLAGSLQGPDFWDELRDGSATFAGSEAYQEAAEKLLVLKEHAQDDPFGRGYEDGNIAFAGGESVMYVQGTWAIPEILSVNPDKNIGAFVMPVGDTADDSVILSAPDSVVGIAENSGNAEAAQEFVDYLFSAQGQATFTEDQRLFSVRDDVTSAEDVLAPLKTDWIDTGRTAMYPDGMFTGASDLAALTQTFLQDEDTGAFLEALDTDFQSHGIQ